jgi:hypothetical protein
VSLIPPVFLANPRPFRPSKTLSFNPYLSQAAIYEKAGVVASETLNLIKTVMLFGTYDKEASRFSLFLADSYERGGPHSFILK